ncbi:MAG: AsmA family protein [Calditrichia bacterium]
MKKLVIFLVTLVLFLLAALIALPAFFSDSLAALVKEELNRELDAQVEFSDLNLSAFRAFPNIALGLDDLLIVNNPPFSDTLVQLERLDFSLGLTSLFSGKQDIRSVVLQKPKLNLRILEDGRTNWDIMKASAEEQPADTSSGGFNFGIQSYSITDGSLSYTNEPKNTALNLKGFNHQGSGDFNSDNFLLNTETRINAINYANEGNSYLSEALFESTADIEVDLTTKRYTLKENSFRLNDLNLQLNGWVQEIADGYNTSVVFSAPEAKIEDILSLLPLIYGDSNGDISGNGLVMVKGSVNGVYSEEKIPAFKTEMTVKKGSFKYAALPSSVEGIELDLIVENKGDEIDDIFTRLNQLNFRINNNPISARLVLTKPLTDMQVDGAVKGTLNLNDLKSALPMEDGVKLSGAFDTDLKFNGSLKALEENQPERFSSSGKLNLSDIRYEDASLPEVIQVNKANLTFNSTLATLNQLDATIGSSDLKVSGKLQNLFGYAMANQPLYGSLNMNSNSFNLNPWIEGESETIEPPRLPENIEFLINATAGRVQVDNLDMTDVKGEVLLKGGRLSLNNLSGNTLSGSMVATGSYEFDASGKPKMDFALNLDKLSIPDLFKNIVTVQKLMPFASYMGGDISGQLTLNAPLDNTFMPEWAQLLSQGKMQIPKVNVKDFSPFNKISEYLKISRLKDPSLSNLRPSYYIKDGRFVLEPLLFAVDQYNIEASGSNGLDKSLDYLFKVTLPASELKNSANAEIAKLLNTDISLLGSAPVTVDLKVTGKPDSPTIKPAGVNIVQNIADPLKEKARQESEAAKKKLEDQLNKDLQKKKDELKNSVNKKLKGLFGGGKK